VKNSSVAISNLAGTNFVSGATVKLQRTGETPISATAVVRSSASKITCTLDLTGAATGAWDVVVTNPDGGFGILSGGFTVYDNPAPTVTGITPSTGPNDSSVSITNLAGTGFLTGATVKLQKSNQTSITAEDIIVQSATQITCTLDLTGAATGPWDVVVTNRDGQLGTKAGAFTISDPVPTITSITPATGISNNINVTGYVLTGTGFRTGAAVTLTRTGQTAIAATAETVLSDTQMTCSLQIATTKAAGLWNVVVTTTGGTGTLPNGFTVANPVPTVSTITPSTGANNNSALSITNLAGTGFLAGATVKLQRTGQTDITATNVVVASSTKITCTLNLTDKAAGDWAVVMTNPDGQAATNQPTFTITNGYAAPTVTGITPSSGGTGDSVSITDLAGTGFRTGATVKLRKAGQGDIAATDVAVVSATQITCTLNLAGAAAGAWDVVVGNPDGQSGTLSGGFTVGDPAPTVTGITPNAGASGANVSITNLAGTGFVTGAAVRLLKTGETGIAAADVVVVSSSKITCDLDLTGAPVGAWGVVVTNPDGQSGTLASAFTVTHGASTGLTITPNPTTATAGEAVSYTATAEDAQGNTWDATADTTFGVDTGAGGTWAANVYTSEKTGDWTVTGDYDGVKATAALHVGAGTATKLTLAPNPGTVAAGGAITYTATAQDAQGNSVDVSATTTFGIDTGAGGTWAANVYTSEKTGDWTVTGDYDGVKATAALHVGAGTALAVSNVTGSVGQTVQLSAKLTAGGAPLAGQSVAFLANDVAVSSGTTDAAGVAAVVYGPLTAGDKTITARFSGVSPYTATTGTDTLTVNAAAPKKITLTLTPSSLVSGEATTCKVMGDNNVEYTNACTYYAQYGAGGAWSTVAPKNIYTAAKAGTWNVTAVYNTLTDTKPLTVTAGVATAVTLTPATATINAGQTQAYTVTATDAAGNVSTPPASSLSHNGAGSLTDYTYTAAAGDAGNAVTITANVDGKTTTATLNVNATAGPGTILAWDKDTKKFYLCSNATNPELGTEITGSATYNGIPVVLSGTGTNVTVAAAGASLRVTWYLRSGGLYRAYEYSTISGVTKTATYDGTRTLVDGTWKVGFSGLTHTISGGTATYGSAQQ
ncbi:MAG: beta strand repeat-containing protein, partial [Bacteroidota bacterium]